MIWDIANVKTILKGKLATSKNCKFFYFVNLADLIPRCLISIFNRMRFFLKKPVLAIQLKEKFFNLDRKKKSMTIINA